jgi:multidrug efflux pump subunit AcrA (membrane-fusion protein)
LFLHRERDV